MRRIDLVASRCNQGNRFIHSLRLRLVEIGFVMTESVKQSPRSAEGIEVSVVLPCLNEERTLAGCIETIKKAFEVHSLIGEIIVADNGSTDGSLAKLFRFTAVGASTKEERCDAS